MAEGRFANGQPANNHEGMESELHRLSSFSNFQSSEPLRHYIGSYTSQGLYYGGVRDELICFRCRLSIRLDRIEPEMPIFDIHWQHVPPCPFLRGEDQTNIPLTAPATYNTVIHPEQLEDVQSQTSPTRKPKPVLLEHLGINEQEPMNRAHAPRSVRETTFVNFPIPQISGEMAKAGFFYTGIPDRVKCFHCNGVLYNWSGTEDPMKEHGKWFSHCPFVIQSMGLEFVEGEGAVGGVNYSDDAAETARQRMPLFGIEPVDNLDYMRKCMLEKTQKVKEKQYN